MVLDKMGAQDEGGDLGFVFGEVTYEKRLESNIPREVVEPLLAQVKETLPAKLPLLGSTIIEDFIAEKLRAGLSEVEIVKAFGDENVGGGVSSYIDGLKNLHQEIDWGGVFSGIDVDVVKNVVTQEMKEMGLPEEMIKKICDMRVELGELFGSSHAGENMIMVSRMQALRKAKDYTAVFPEVGLEEVLKVILKTTVGHELGHHINNLTPGIATNQINSEWKSKDGWSDNKSERFSEYWGRVAVVEDPRAETMRQREWLVQVEKVYSVWDSLAERNSKLPDQEKVDLFAIFRGIEDSLSGNEDALALISARRGLYGGTEVECYALPYSRDVIKQSVKQDVSTVVK